MGLSERILVQMARCGTGGCREHGSTEGAAGSRDSVVQQRISASSGSDP